MLRTPPTRLHSRVFNSDASARWAGVILLGLAFGASSALACTAADMAAHDAAEMHQAGVMHTTPAARLNPRGSIAPAEGLKLRMRQQDAVLSAYLPPASLAAQARATSLPASTERSAARTERSSPLTLPAKAAPDDAANHTYKPLAMLAAALALMVSIALRRSGKR